MQSFQMQAKTFPNLTLNDILQISIVKIRHMTMYEGHVTISVNISKL